MSLSKSIWKEWEREFPFLTWPMFVDLSSQIDKISVRRMDVELLKTVLRTQEYRCVSFGDACHWVRGFVITLTGCDELKVGLSVSTAGGAKWSIDVPSIGEQIKDLRDPIPEDLEAIDQIEAIVVVEHDDGDYNGSQKTTQLVIHKSPRKGTKDLMDAYWASVRRAISDEVAKADIVG